MSATPGYPYSTNQIQIRTRQETISPPLIIDGVSYDSRIRTTGFRNGEPISIVELGERNAQHSEESHRLAALSAARVPERLTTVSSVARKPGGYLFTIHAFK